MEECAIAEAATWHRWRNPSGQKAANSLFWNILQVSRLSAIFCRDRRISKAGKSGRIKNLAASAQKKLIDMKRLKHGGEGGIRTPDTLSGMPVFKTGAINHSATSPVL